MKKGFSKIAILTAVAAFGALLPGACAPAVEPETAIPADFITYTDAAGLFSISYPSDWAPDISTIENSEEFVQEILAALEADETVAAPNLVFFAGVPAEVGYMPNVNVLVESLPDIDYTHDSMVAAEIRGIRDLIEDYHRISRIETTAGGRQATVLEWEGTYPDLGRGHWLQMFTLVGKTAWIVTCTVPPDDPGGRMDDYNAIVRSLRILR